MSICYAIVDQNTGAFHDNCGSCGYGRLGGPLDFQATDEALDENHTIREVSFEEMREIATSIEDIDEKQSRYSKGLDLKEAKKSLKDRSDKEKSAVITIERAK